MAKRPSTLLDLLANLSRLNLAPPSSLPRKEDSKSIERACGIILDFIERRLEKAEMSKDEALKCLLREVRRNAFECQQAAKTALRSPRASKLDRVRRTYDTLGRSLRKIIQKEDERLLGLLDSALGMLLYP